MSEQPIDLTVVQSGPESAHAHLARRLLVEEKFHSSVVVAQLERNGCDKQTAQTIVDAVCRAHPQVADYRKGSETLSVIFWILLGAAASFILYIITVVIMILSMQD